MKKITTLFLSIIVLLFTCIPAFAINDPVIVDDKATFVLYDDSGNSYELDAELVETNNSASIYSASNNFAKTYNVAIPKRIVSDNHNSTGADSSYCANVSLTIYYTVNNSVIPSLYRLDGASGSYTITDPNVTSWNADLNFFYGGHNPSTGVWARDTDKIKNIGTPFNYYTGYSVFVAPIEGYLDQIGSSVVFNFKMGTRSFTGEFKVTV